MSIDSCRMYFRHHPAHLTRCRGSTFGYADAQAPGAAIGYRCGSCVMRFVSVTGLDNIAYRAIYQNLDAKYEQPLAEPPERRSDPISSANVSIAWPTGSVESRWRLGQESGERGRPRVPRPLQLSRGESGLTVVVVAAPPCQGTSLSTANSRKRSHRQRTCLWPLAWHAGTAYFARPDPLRTPSGRPRVP
jgi:hypothetical protein